MRAWLKDLVCTAANEMERSWGIKMAHGAHEIGAGLFTGSSFVMYPRHGHDDQPDIHHGLPEQAQVEHEREM